jgi:GTP-binding protein Era
MLTPGRGFRNGPFASEIELREVVDLAQQRGVVAADERRMIQSVFELGDTPAREVMVPRTEMIWIESDKSADQATSVAVRSGHSRIPVIGENVDDVVGVVYLKDCVQQAYYSSAGGRDTAVAEVMRPAVFVPDSKPLDELLREMQRDRNHMTLLVDEYGAIAGLVTIEDVLEEIVGEIADEYDAAEVAPWKSWVTTSFGYRRDCRSKMSASCTASNSRRISTSTRSAGCWPWSWVAFRYPAPRWYRTACGYMPRVGPTTAGASASALCCSAARKWWVLKMTEFHSGFVCFVGRPNTGKSTLTNALVGSKVAITSSRPQTTRHTIRGIVHREDFQIILVDTPGLHRPRTLLGKRLNDLVRDTYSEVDAIGLCIPADEAIGPGDRWIVEQIRSTVPRTTLVAVVTKIDKVPKDKLAAQLVAVSELLGDSADIVPVSATTGEQIDVLIEVLVAALPPGPPYYPDGELTDEPEEVLMAEFIREAALEGVRDELPHSLAVVIDEVNPREGRDDLIDVHAVLFVERDSQKGIVIGKGGARLREVGTAARGQIEKLLGTKVYLDLRVKVAKNWQRDPKQLGRLGF